MNWIELFDKYGDPEEARRFREVRAELEDLFEKSWAAYLDHLRGESPSETKETARKQFWARLEPPESPELKEEVPAEIVAEIEARAKKGGAR